MAPLFYNSGSYINEIEKKSYPMGTPSKGYDANGMKIPYQSSFLNANPESSVAPPAYVPPASNPPVVNPPANNPPVTQPTRSKYIDPATGEYFKTAEEYGNYVATKIPVSGDIPKYASDAMTAPDQSTTSLESTARNLNNARNDLAVGETSMFAGSDKTAGGEQIIYSPAEKEAIRKASAGIYDPALNDVFARLKEKKTADEKEQRKQDQIFATNESIRQWQATTGSKGSVNGLTQDDLNYLRVVNGIGDISSMTPTDSTAVQNRLYQEGFYDSEPPAWFVKQMEAERAEKGKKDQMSLTPLTPEQLAVLWEAHRNPIITSITTSLNGLKMDFSNPGQ